MTRTTLLDEFIITCEKNANVMPVMKHLRDIIRETPPVAHLWNSDIDKHLIRHAELPARIRRLPGTPLMFEDSAMCLCSDAALIADYRFCVDTGSPEFKKLMGNTSWSLRGVLIFQQSDSSFDVIPMIKNVRNPVLAEVQLHYELINNVWQHTLARTGPVNPMFHEYFISKLDDEMKSEVYRDVEYLGDVCDLFIGSYIAFVSQKGSYTVHPAYRGKAKIKDGKTKKYYKLPAVGYKEFKPDENKDPVVSTR